MTDLPVLNESERQELERIAGRKLSNEGAQVFRCALLGAPDLITALTELSEVAGGIQANGCQPDHHDLAVALNKAAAAIDKARWNAQ